LKQFVEMIHWFYGYFFPGIKINDVDNSGYLLTIKPAIRCRILHLSTNMSTKPPFLQALQLLILSTKLGNRAQNPNKARVTSRIEQMGDWEELISLVLVLLFQMGIKPALLLGSIDGRVSISSLLNIFLSLCIRSTTNLLENSSGIK
jgi:hypothetical protein